MESKFTLIFIRYLVLCRWLEHVLVQMNREKKLNNPLSLYTALKFCAMSECVCLHRNNHQFKTTIPETKHILNVII